MKTFFSSLLIILCVSFLSAQDSVSVPTAPKFKFTATYGIASIDPEQINDHIAASNTVFGTSTKTFKSVPELALTCSMRPMESNAILLFRFGYMSLERSFQISIPETADTTDVTGRTTGSIRETYTAYPISIGAGLTSPDMASQISLEFIYGLGYIEEETSYTSSSGRKTSVTRSLFSPAFGIRIAGNTTVRFSEHVGLTLEAGYRGLAFDDYENEATQDAANLKFSYSGLFASIGLSVLF